MGLSTGTVSTQSNACSPLGNYNSTFSSINSRTNQNLPINTTLSGQPNASSLNQNFINLLSNVRTKIEATVTVQDAHAEPMLEPTISGSTLYFKVDNASYPSVKVTSMANSTTCVNDTYCKKSFSSEVSIPYQLANIQLKDSSNNTINKSIYLTKTATSGTAPYRAEDRGCHNADTVSAESYNIWACMGGSGNCFIFCHKGVCRSNNSYWASQYGYPYDPDPVRTLFNTYFNTSGEYTYTSWGHTTGDIRAGCGGLYVYGMYVTYSVNKYQIKCQ